MEPRFVVRIVFRIWWMGSAGSRTICRIGVDSSQRRSATGQALSLRRDSVVGGVGGGDLEVLVAAGAQHGLVDAALSGLQVGGGKGGGVAGGGAALGRGAEFLKVGLDRSGAGCIEARNGCWADQKSFDDGLNLLGSAGSGWADRNTRTAAVAKSTHAEHGSDSV
jgi:hypothetical protein